jgi:hypothetical protein
VPAAKRFADTLLLFASSSSFLFFFYFYYYHYYYSLPSSLPPFCLPPKPGSRFPPPLPVPVPLRLRWARQRHHHSHGSSGSSSSNTGQQQARSLLGEGGGGGGTKGNRNSFSPAGQPARSLTAVTATHPPSNPGLVTAPLIYCPTHNYISFSVFLGVVFKCSDTLSAQAHGARKEEEPPTDNQPASQPASQLWWRPLPL